MLRERRPVGRLCNHQEAEIRRTIERLRKEGKDPFRISPYYASLMQEDPFKAGLRPASAVFI